MSKPRLQDIIISTRLVERKQHKMLSQDHRTYREVLAENSRLSIIKTKKKFHISRFLRATLRKGIYEVSSEIVRCRNPGVAHREQDIEYGKQLALDMLLQSPGNRAIAKQDLYESLWSQLYAIRCTGLLIG